ncbi:radical SAM protein [Candidatus Margulisiibacteriota bacterium]
MKIVLLNGPCTKNFARTGRWQATSRGASLWYPIWLAACASVLEDAGLETKLIDAPAYDYSLDRTISEIRDFSPQLCIIDTSTSSINYDLETAKQIKAMISKSIKICLVGPHASALPEEVISNENVDFVAIGEYDYTVRDLARRLNKDPNDNGEGVAGLWGKQKGGIIKNEKRPLIENLDELPFASKIIFEQLDIRKYGLDFTLHPYMNIMTSRGCPYKCTYCLWPQTLSGGKYRERSLDHVFKEIDYVLRCQPKIREIFFDDDTFTVRLERVKEFCERYIKGNYKIPFSVNARPTITDEKLLRLLKQAGLRCLVVGFESGDQGILDAVKKNTRLEEMKEFARLCHKLRIQVHGDFVFGLPGENHETIKNTTKFAKELSLSTFQLSIAMPLPGTEFYRWLDQNNYLVSRDFRDWIDANGRQKCVINYPDLSNLAIEDSIANSIKNYYFSWQFMKSAFKQILSNPSELKRYLWGGRRLFHYFYQRKI